MLEVGFDEFAGCTVAGSLAVVRIEVEDGKVIELDDMFCQFFCRYVFRVYSSTIDLHQSSGLLIHVASVSNRLVNIPDDTLRQWAFFQSLRHRLLDSLAMFKFIDTR